MTELLDPDERTLSTSAYPSAISHGWVLPNGTSRSSGLRHLPSEAERSLSCERHGQVSDSYGESVIGPNHSRALPQCDQHRIPESPHGSPSVGKWTYGGVSDPIPGGRRTHR